MYGYAGKVLYIDLTTGKAREEPVDGGEEGGDGPPVHRG